MSSSERYAIGIDLGGTTVKIVAVTREGSILREERFGTCDDAAAAWVPMIRERVEWIESELGSAGGIGVGAPGFSGREARAVSWMMGRLEALMGLDWTEALGRTAMVPVINDAHAALLGEIWLGAARRARDVVMLTLGTGVGGAIMCDGQLLRGHLGRAGHLGHISLDAHGRADIVGTPGSLEDAIGECTLARRCGNRFATTEKLVAALRMGDAEARRVWLESVRALAAALASIINAVDPALVILGGGIAGAGTELLEPLRRYMDEFEWRPAGNQVEIVLAALGDRSGALGAAQNAQRYFEDSAR